MLPKTALAHLLAFALGSLLVVSLTSSSSPPPLRAVQAPETRAVERAGAIYFLELDGTETLAAPAPAPAAAPVNDWFPPNPYYSGLSPGSAGLPIPIAPPCPSPKVRNPTCAADALSDYQEGAADLEQFCHDLYDSMTESMDAVIDHLGEACGHCLQECAPWDDACADACWESNAIQSQNAYLAHLAQKIAIAALYADEMAALRADYLARMAACCQNVTQPPPFR